MPTWLEPFMQDWKPNFFWAIIVGIPIAFILDFIRRQRKQLEYQIASTVLLSPEMSQIPGVQITVDSQSVEKLTSTLVTFTNTGNQKIEENDFAQLAPLGLLLKDGHFLQHKFEAVSDNDKMNLKIERIDDENVHISFEFIRPAESFSVTLLHDGALSVCGELKEGNIREHKKPSPIFGRIVFEILKLILMFLYGVLVQWLWFYYFIQGINEHGPFNTVKDGAPYLLIAELILIVWPILAWHISKELASGFLEMGSALFRLFQRLKKEFFKQ